VAAREPDQTVIERALARPVSGTAKAGWGFTNRTDFVTLGSGERVVLQRYRNPSDAAYRLRVMRGLWAPAAAAGIAIPRIRESGLDRDPAWVIFDVLPGVPVPEAGDAAPGGPRFGEAARRMGELLTAFRQLPAGELAINDLWADPVRLAASAAGWASELGWLSAAERSALAGLLDRVPALFAGRPAVLTHGDFAPVNVLTDGVSLTGLLDFEAVRRADQLFDPAWWAWSVSFSGPGVLDVAWPLFLRGAGLDPDDPGLPARVSALQVLRMLELLVPGSGLDPGIQDIVADRLRAEVAWQTER
jgi:aminoglycoside phosphotransferase (APT) family kinase protein